MGEKESVSRAVVPLLLGCAVALGACRDNVIGTAAKTPVPAVHRVPADVEGTVILIADDPIIESKDPMHLERAKEKNVPHDYRVAMVQALELAGFRVVEKTGTHDLLAKLALAVEEEGSVVPTVHQTYRCGLYDNGGALVAQVDWRWPKDIYVDVYDVYPFATRSLATEITTSRKVMDWLHAHKRGRGAAVTTPAAAADAGSSP
jgi:hypothetical protein